MPDRLSNYITPISDGHLFRPGGSYFVSSYTEAIA